MPSLLRPKALLIDTCAWIAYLLGSEPQASEVMQLLEACDRCGVTPLYTATTLKDVFYLVSRQLRREAVSAGVDVENVSFAPAAWACVGTMTEVATAANLSLAECDLAWTLGDRHSDFEDNLQVAAAETAGADYLVTYDRKLLERFSPACVTPAQALNLFGGRPQ